jgi:hypothetical protein
MYRGYGFWPIEAFIHKILRSATNTHQNNLRNKAMKKSRQKVEKGEEDEVDEPGLEVDPPIGIERHLEGVDNLDVTMASEGDAIDIMAEEVSKMTLDLDTSTCRIQGKKPEI